MAPWLHAGQFERLWICGLTFLGSVAFAANWGQSHLLAELPWPGVGTRHEQLHVVFSFPAFPSCPPSGEQLHFGEWGWVRSPRDKDKGSWLSGVSFLLSRVDRSSGTMDLGVLTRVRSSTLANSVLEVKDAT